jgi:hypothetical protein
LDGNAYGQDARRKKYVQKLFFFCIPIKLRAKTITYIMCRSTGISIPFFNTNQVGKTINCVVVKKIIIILFGVFSAQPPRRSKKCDTKLRLERNLPTSTLNRID